MCFCAASLSWPLCDYTLKHCTEKTHTHLLRYKLIKFMLLLAQNLCSCGVLFTGRCLIYTLSSRAKLPPQPPLRERERRSHTRLCAFSRSHSMSHIQYCTGEMSLYNLTHSHTEMKCSWCTWLGDPGLGWCFDSANRFPRPKAQSLRVKWQKWC